MSRIRKSDLGPMAAAAPLDTAEGGRFSRTIRLTLPTGGQAERAEVAPGTVLETLFRAAEADALSPGAVEPAVLTNSGGQLVLSLPVARKVRRVRLKGPVGGDQIAAFRFDGQAVSDDPVKTAAHGAQGAQLDVTDAQLILKRRNGGDFPLNPGAVESVTLRYAPVNPRLALRLAGQSGTGTPFPARTNSDGTPIFPADGTHGPDLAAAMTALLGSLAAPLPDPLEVDLVLSADEPCTARIDALDLSLILEAKGLGQKAVLRFPGGRREMRTVPLALPPGAVLSGGSLSVSVSGTPADQAARREPAGVSAAPATGDGLRVSAATVVTTRLDLAEAQVIVGARLVLAAPEGPAELRALLHADRDGLPANALAESKPLEVTRARPTETAFGFPPTALPAGPVWLGIAALSGKAVAMLGGSGHLARSDGPSFAMLVDDAGRGLAAQLLPVAATESDTPTGGGPAILVGDTRLAGLPASGAATIDLLPGLAALSGGASLHVSSAARAVVTLDPPLLRYGIAG